MRTAAVRLTAMTSPVLLLLACTSGGDPGPMTSTQVKTVINTVTDTPSNGLTAPVPTGPTTAAKAASCPLLPEQEAANRVGMRLERITVLRSSGKVVGCRFYALQNSPYHNSEHLPGPDQPAIEIETVRYGSSVAAHNAFVLEARRGANPQQATIGKTTGVCFQTDFYPHDKGKDWACAFNVGAVKVSVRTVVVSPALNVVQVSRVVARHV